MPQNPAMFIVWAVFGLLLGGAMFLALGGNPYIHMGIGVVGGIAGGAFAQYQRNKRD